MALLNQILGKDVMIKDTRAYQSDHSIKGPQLSFQRERYVSVNYSKPYQYLNNATPNTPGPAEQTSKYTISEVEPNLDSLVLWTKAQYSAFLYTDNVLHETLFPPATNPTPDQVIAGAKRHLASVKSDPEHVKFIWVLDPQTGDVAGAAKWQLYDVDANRPAKVNVDWVGDPDSKDRQFAQKVMDEFQGRRAERMGGPHALLDICFTTPNYERKGVASLLVDYGISVADAKGWKSFTEASPRGEPVYKRKGFVTKEPVRLRWDEEGFGHKGDIVWFYMEREPQSPNP